MSAYRAPSYGSAEVGTRTEAARAERQWVVPGTVYTQLSLPPKGGLTEGVVSRAGWGGRVRLPTGPGTGSLTVHEARVSLRTLCACMCHCADVSDLLYRPQSL